ncbi:MAG: DUF1573 domain-containing protein [Planctomycetaceae bacterium]|nr:DUF1573 domain-containing protein [Planctomycetaceae bacterium]
MRQSPLRKSSVSGIFVAASFVLLGCAEADRQNPESQARLVLGSSADLGCVVANGSPITRLVRVRNTRNAELHVSEWRVSCECLSVEPPAIDLPPGAESYVLLVFDPSKEGKDFAGDLLISVDALSADSEAGSFTVPVSVIAPSAVEHLTESPA